MFSRRVMPSAITRSVRPRRWNDGLVAGERWGDRSQPCRSDVAGARIHGRGGDRAAPGARRTNHHHRVRRAAAPRGRARRLPPAIRHGSRPGDTSSGSRCRPAGPARVLTARRLLVHEGPRAAFHCRSSSSGRRSASRDRGRARGRSRARWPRTARRRPLRRRSPRTRGPSRRGSRCRSTARHRLVASSSPISDARPPITAVMNCACAGVSSTMSTANGAYCSRTQATTARQVAFVPPNAGIVTPSSPSCPAAGPRRDRGRRSPG